MFFPRDTYSLTLAPGALLLVLLVPAALDSLSDDSSGSNSDESENSDSESESDFEEAES